MSDASTGSIPCRPEWFTPGSYSVWVFVRDGSREPILVVAYEWTAAGLCAVRSECVWLSEEDDPNIRWEDYPEFEQISGGVEAASFASLIEQGKVIRVGVMPPIGRWAEPPSWLRS